MATPAPASTNAAVAIINLLLRAGRAAEAAGGAAAGWVGSAGAGNSGT